MKKLSIKNKPNIKKIKSKLTRDNMKKWWKKIKNESQKIIENYPLVIIFIASSIINSIILRTITVKNPLEVKALLADLGGIMIISALTIFVKKKKSSKILIALSFLTTLTCIINSAYYSYYSSFASFSMLATATFIVEVGDAVVDQVIEFKDFIYLWQPLVMIYSYQKLKKKEFYKEQYPKSSRKQTAISISVLGVVCLLLASTMMTKTNWSRFSKMWNRESVVDSFGIYIYQINDLFQSLEPQINNLFGHDKALKEVVEFYENREETTTANAYTNIFKDKNIICIHAESFQTLAMSLSFNGEELTPNVNKLASEGIFFSNYYSQIGVGTSSDAEFTFSTSLMPSSNGTVFVSYFDTEFVTLQKLLKAQGYRTFSMHGNTADFWNRSIMHKNMGYDKFYSKSSYEIDETIGLGLSDKSFFRQSIEKIKEEASNNQPYYAQLITLTNHTPFNDLDLMDEYPTTVDVEIEGTTVTRNYLEDTTLGNYFRSIHYADQAIGEFVEALDREGLLDNTVLIIYGDHDSRISKSNYDLLYNYDPITDTVLTEEDEGYKEYNEYEYELDKKVPLIIWTKDKQYSTEINTPAGMIDALPTLGNMFGIKSNYQLGHDLMSIKKEDNIVVFNDASYLTDKVYYNSQKGEIYPLTNEAIDESYISEKSKYADEIINVSNNIITYDLIKEIEEKK